MTKQSSRSGKKLVKQNDRKKKEIKKGKKNIEAVCFNTKRQRQELSGSVAKGE